MKNKFEYYRSVALLFFYMVASAASAQEYQKQARHFGGFGYFTMGYQGFNLSAMNDVLSQSGYPAINSGSLSFGGGGHYLMNNWLIGGEGAGLPGGSAENTDYSVELTGGYGVFNLGYLAWRTPSFYLYPVLGIGGGGITMSLKDKGLSGGSFSDVLEDPSRESYVTNSGLLINLSIMANYIIMGERKEEYAGGFIIGLKAGYLLNASSNSWTSGSEELNGSPAAGMSGPYLSIILGGGGSGRKN